MKHFPTPAPEQLAAFAADCPECEYCCAIGLCCPAEKQFLAATALFVRAGQSVEEAAKAANALVAGRVKANEKHAA